jgi:hypothetical protein
MRALLAAPILIGALLPFAEVRGSATTPMRGVRVAQMARDVADAVRRQRNGRYDRPHRPARACGARHER